MTVLAGFIAGIAREFDVRTAKGLAIAAHGPAVWGALAQQLMR
jgi:hypothetical protein